MSIQVLFILSFSKNVGKYLITNTLWNVIVFKLEVFEIRIKFLPYISYRKSFSLIITTLPCRWQVIKLMKCNDKEISSCKNADNFCLLVNNW